MTEARNVWLATARPDGRPHLAPVWFVVVDDRLWMCTGRDSVRVRNLRANPSASACLEPGGEPVVAEGTVAIHEAIHETGQPATVIDAFRTKYDWDITVEVDNLPHLEKVLKAVRRVRGIGDVERREIAGAIWM